MRASDAERERIAEVLREAVAEGRLRMEEFEQRLDAAYRARTHGELEPLVRDLPAPGGAAVAPVAGGRPRTGSMARWPDRVGRPATSRGAFAFWGGFSRRGHWTVSRVFTAFAMWGGGEIDLREANFEDGEVVIRCFAIMGGMQVTVPPELNVEVRGIGIMGGFGERAKDDGDPAPDAPRVRITGLALMGGVGVEHKRSKAEKQRLRNAELPSLEKGDREA
ncbi:DUF1707 domain-containing protein [Streptomyces sp. A0642]|uniref:DUF1707 domain-containing protein n=1 Tax=Streptomyces sp. A0642 TaxID=2563100 RepID=UPI0019D276BF|nr:DUF1707 domain-containing protein [Streptomyces sp. A0642]